MRVHSLRCSEMSIPGQPADQGGLSGGSSLWEPSERKLHPIALTLFPSIHLLMPSGAQFAGSPSLQGCSTNILLVPRANGSQCFLLATVSLKDHWPLYTHWQLSQGILVSWGACGYSHPHQRLSMGSFHPSLCQHQNLNHFQGSQMCWVGALSLQGEMQGDFPARKREQMLWWGPGLSPLTVGKCDSLPGIYTEKRK